MSSTPSQPEPGAIHAHPRGVTIDVRVQPRASRTQLDGVHAGSLRVRLAAPPVDGAANAELIAFLARRLGIRREEIEIVAGARGRRKRILITGLDRAAVEQRLVLPSRLE